MQNQVVLFYPDKNWELSFMTKNPRFEEESGATIKVGEQRMSFVYQFAITIMQMQWYLSLSGKGIRNYLETKKSMLTIDNDYLTPGSSELL